MVKKPSDIDDVLNVISDLAALVSKQFAGVEKHFTDIDIQLFKQSSELAEVKSDLKDVKEKVNHVYNVLDSHMKRIEDIMQNNVARDYQQQRIETWIFQLADKVGLKLKYD